MNNVIVSFIRQLVLGELHEMHVRIPWVYIILGVICLYSQLGCTVIEVEPMTYGILRGRVALNPPSYGVLYEPKAVMVLARGKEYRTVSDDSGYWSMRLPRGVYSLSFSNANAITDTTYYFPFLGIDTFTLRTWGIQQVAHGWLRVDSLYTREFSSGFGDCVKLSCGISDSALGAQYEIHVVTADTREALDTWQDLRYGVYTRQYYEPDFYIGIRGRAKPHYFWRAILLREGLPCFDTTKGKVFDDSTTFAATPIYEVDHR